jgi:16S rRNA processing protein RimM
VTGDAADAGWVVVAQLGRPRGRRGELTAVALSSFPDRLRELRRVFLFAGGESVEMEIEEAWLHGDRWVLKFRGVDSIGDAERWRGAEVRVPAVERRPAAMGEYYLDDLVGCRVLARATGVELGRVTGWEEAGGQVLLSVGNDVWIPFAARLLPRIDPAAGVIEVDLPDGLWDLNRA